MTTAHENKIIQTAMLAEQAAWLEEADAADSFTMISIAKVIAEAFEKAAAKYKAPIAQRTDEMGWSDSDVAFRDDEHGKAPGVLAES